MTLSFCRMVRKVFNFKDYSFLCGGKVKKDLLRNKYAFNHLFSPYVDFFTLSNSKKVPKIFSANDTRGREHETDRISNHYGFYQIRNKARKRSKLIHQFRKEMVLQFEKQNICVKFNHYTDFENQIVCKVFSQEQVVILMFDVLNGDVSLRDKEDSPMKRKKFLFHEREKWQTQWMHEVQLVIEENELINEFQPDTHFLKIFLDAVEKKVNINAPSILEGIYFSTRENMMLHMMTQIGGFQQTVLLLKKLTEIVQNFNKKQSSDSTRLNIRAIEDFNFWKKNKTKKVIVEIYEEQTHYFLLTEKVRSDSSQEVFYYSNELKNLWEYL